MSNTGFNIGLQNQDLEFLKLIVIGLNINIDIDNCYCYVREGIPEIYFYKDPKHYHYRFYVYIKNYTLSFTRNNNPGGWDESKHLDLRSPNNDPVSWVNEMIK